MCRCGGLWDLPAGHRAGGVPLPASAAPVQVEVLFQTAERAVVRGGALRPGMELVVEGNERLYPMAPIQPIPAGGEDAPR